MKKHILALMVVCALALSASVCAVDFDNSTIDGLNTTSDIDAAFKLSQSENKTLAIFFDQDNCAYCEMFKSDTLSDSDVQKILNDRFIVLMVDINKNPDIADKYDIFGTPTVQFIDSNGKEMGRIEGYYDSGEFLDIIKGI